MRATEKLTDSESWMMQLSNGTSFFYIYKLQILVQDFNLVVELQCWSLFDLTHTMKCVVFFMLLFKLMNHLWHMFGRSFIQHLLGLWSIIKNICFAPYQSRWLCAFCYFSILFKHLLASITLHKRSKKASILFLRCTFTCSYLEPPQQVPNYIVFHFALTKFSLFVSVKFEND